MNTDDLGASTETTTSGKTVGHRTKKNVDLSSLNKRISAHFVGRRRGLTGMS